MNKKNVLLLSMATVVMTGLGAFLLKDKSDRIRLKNHTEEDEGVFPIEKAGQPEPDNIPDNKMVSEGAQFGVQYYNRVKEK